MYTAASIDTPYAFYVAGGLDDDVLEGDNAVKAANAHLAGKFDMPALLTARSEAIRTFDLRSANPNDNTERDYADARRVFDGMLASLRAHWDRSPEGIQSAYDVGI